MKTAILIDGGFFLRRYKYILGFNVTDSPEVIAKNIVSYSFRHLTKINKKRTDFGLPLTDLLRIYYYDALPFDGDSKNPISNKAISFKKTHIYKERVRLFAELKKQRKIALRLGFLKNSNKYWVIRAKYTKSLINGTKLISNLTPDDVEFPLSQKAVDMKIGLDIASLAFKEQVQQIVLIAGDSDFVPAAKFARRQGIDFILNPMMNHIDSSLHEHIDGLMTIKECKINR